MASNKIKMFSLTGGEDFVTPALEMQAGIVRVAYNYEQNYETGYSRIAGYRKLVNVATPGEGEILGTVVFNDSVYIFRNQVGGLSTGMWKATPAVYNDTVSPATITSNGSWTEIDDMVEANGTTATTLAVPDGYFEFALHNFSATARDVGNFVGDWAATTSYNAGDIINDSGGVLGAAGTKYTTNIPHKSSASLATDTAFWHDMDWDSDTAPTDAHDVSGNSGYLYGVDGKNPAWEFNGTQLRKIDSTYVTDTPMHIEANANRLCLGFRSGELALSELGNPYGFDPVLGAGSIGITDFLTGMAAGPDGVLYIFAKNKIYLLYGMSGPLSQTELKKHSKDIGAYPYSQQTLAGNTVFFDKWGITSLEASDRFGDVITNTLSAKIQPLVTAVQPITSVSLKSKAQYRTYFVENGSDTTVCLIGTFLKDAGVGFTHAEYPMAIVHSSSGLIGTDEYSIAGTDDGEVYHMDAGTNFGGVAYTSYLSLPFFFMDAPYTLKRYRKFRITVDADAAVNLTYGIDFDFGTGDIPKETGTELISPVGARWGSGIWNEFFWGTGLGDFVEAYVNGISDSLSVTINSESATDAPHTLKDITFIYEQKRVAH